MKSKEESRLQVQADGFWTKSSLTMDLIVMKSDSRILLRVTRGVYQRKDLRRKPYPLVSRGYPLSFNLEKLLSYLEKLPSKPLWKLVWRSRKLAKVLLAQTPDFQARASLLQFIRLHALGRVITFPHS
jgi:hypothetical protein